MKLLNDMGLLAEATHEHIAQMKRVPEFERNARVTLKLEKKAP